MVEMVVIELVEKVWTVVDDEVVDEVVDDFIEIDEMVDPVDIPIVKQNDELDETVEIQVYFEKVETVDNDEQLIDEMVEMVEMVGLVELDEVEQEMKMVELVEWGFFVVVNDEVQDVDMHETDEMQLQMFIDSI